EILRGPLQLRGTRLPIVQGNGNSALQVYLAKRINQACTDTNIIGELITHCWLDVDGLQIQGSNGIFSGPVFVPMHCAPKWRVHAYTKTKVILWVAKNCIGLKWRCNTVFVVLFCGGACLQETGLQVDST